LWKFESKRRWTLGGKCAGWNKCGAKALSIERRNGQVAKALAEFAKKDLFNARTLGKDVRKNACRLRIKYKTTGLKAAWRRAFGTGLFYSEF
jgi:hypothetical protein